MISVGSNPTVQFASIAGPLSHTLGFDHNGDKELQTFTDARSNATSYTYGNAGEPQARDVSRQLAGRIQI